MAEFNIILLNINYLLLSGFFLNQNVKVIIKVFVILFLDHLL